MRLASKVAVPPIGQEADRHADPGQRVFPELHCFRNRFRQLRPPVPQVELAAFGELVSQDHSGVASFCFGGRAQGAQQTNNPVSNRSSRSASSRGSLLGVRFCFYSARCQHAVAASHEWAPVKCRRARKRISLPALYPACCRAQDDRMPEQYRTIAGGAEMPRFMMRLRSSRNCGAEKKRSARSSPRPMRLEWQSGAPTELALLSPTGFAEGSTETPI